MNIVFSVGGDMMQPDIPNNFLKLLSEGEIHTLNFQLSNFSPVICSWNSLEFNSTSFPFIGPGFDSVDEDRKLRLLAVDSYVSLLQGEPGKLPQRFLQVISWVSAV